MCTVSASHVRRLVGVVGLTAILSTTSVACHENLSGPPPSNTVPSLPAAGASAVATIGPEGSASVDLGESRVDFTVLNTQGSPMSGASAAVLLGENWLLVAVSDPQGRVPPAMTAVSTTLFTAPTIAFEKSRGTARRKAITVAQTAPGVLSVIASLETFGVAVRESDLTSDLIDMMETDPGLNLTCDAELDIDTELQSIPASGRFIAFGNSATVLAVTATASPDDIFAELASETDAVSTDVLIGCEVVVGETNSGLRAFFKRTLQFGGIYAHTGRIFANDQPPSTLYLVEVGPNGQDIAVGEVITDDGTKIDLGDIARPTPDVLATGPAMIATAGNRLYKVSRVNGHARLHREFFHGSGGVSGLTSDGATLYGSTPTWLMQVAPLPSNIDTMIRVGEFNLPGLVSIGGLAFSPSGDLYGVFAATTDHLADQNFLARINRNNGEATLIGEITPPGIIGGFDEVWGLRFFRGELYGLTSLPGQLIKINPQTAAAEKVRDLSFNATGAGDRTPD